MQPVANSSFNVEADQLKTYIEEMNGRKPMAHIRSLPSPRQAHRRRRTRNPDHSPERHPLPARPTLLKTISDDLASQGAPTVFYSAELPAYRIAQKGITRSAMETSAFPEATGTIPEKREALSTPAPSTPRP